MTKYAVIMADCDEQQIIIDFSNADSPEQAIAEHMDARDYVCHACAFTSEDLRRLANELDKFRFTEGKQTSRVEA